MNYKMDIVEDCGSYGGSVGSGTSAPEPDFHKAKLNFETHDFSKNPSLWGNIFGYARKVYVSVPDNKRVKLKFWNRNYLLFKSFGTEVRFQKRVKFLWISGWQKSYPTKVALGINNLQYNYDQGAEAFFSSSVFNTLIYTFKGHNYFPDGMPAPYNLPRINYPLAELLGDIDPISVIIVNPFSDINFHINQTPKQHADLINLASTELLNLGIRKGVAWLNLKPSKTSTLFSTQIYKNGTALTLSNKNWLKSNENNITKYFDIRVPTISISANIGYPGEPFFSNIGPSSIPKFSTSNYKTGVIDFYGAVLYNNKWYGKRMVSNNFKKD
jgi:hypothetical protein